MNESLGLLLALSFIVSLAALGALIWSIVTRQIRAGKKEASTIFLEGEAGTPDDPSSFDEGAAEHRFDALRAGVDAPGRNVVLVLSIVSFVFLIVGSLFGMIASLKLHWPDWLANEAFTTFGRARTVHLNLVAYGWLSTGGIAVALWIIPRMFHTPLRRPAMAMVGAVLWALGVAAGAIAIANGWSDGLEWLEIPWQIDIVLALGDFFIAWSAIATTRKRNVHHIYVSGWYYLAGLAWFPILFFIANIPGLHSGVQQATTNWWFAHNVLGLWLTPLGLGAAYYLIPKIIGKPIYSYSVSLLGFWGLALFYSQVGIHHLIGGPVPTWVVTLSIVHSVMMFIPVIAVAINQHVTVAQNFWAFKESMALRFVSTGALMYTAASFQGSLEAVRAINSITHFTHYTVGHAHLGAYAFVSIVLFGAFYYLLPYLTGKNWPCPRLIALHYWLTVLGFLIYFLSLTIGGFLQGMSLLDPQTSFADITRNIVPYLEGRSVGGGMMTLGHFVFAFHAMALLWSKRRGDA
ncbi:cbb3-type cytochrome c oxidase subunit I [Stenotrophomonas maltophilia]|uniref:cbb3-type cytochrome c oxidase subunit I n=1 Tax=Stenotrophomonas maltophilia TaxID=40324 RepID=UPI001E44B5A2|nr:cbb3-type cytochrome c oxidase subunit I [Stenotrophomonas maltophilia]MCD5963782.1 cbb3-type cytochrome c oxidase subunit I [Stenotrophomonas maltophilia]